MVSVQPIVRDSPAGALVGRGASRRAMMPAFARTPPAALARYPRARTAPTIAMRRTSFVSPHRCAGGDSTPSGLGTRRFGSAGRSSVIAARSVLSHDPGIVLLFRATRAIDLG